MCKFIDNQRMTKIDRVHSRHRIAKLNPSLDRLRRKFPRDRPDYAAGIESETYCSQLSQFDLSASRSPRRGGEKIFPKYLIPLFDCWNVHSAFRWKKYCSIWIVLRLRFFSQEDDNRRTGTAVAQYAL
jgi:hypothetical protein